MSRGRLVAIVCLLMAAAPALPALQSSTAAPKTHTVTIADMKFAPDTVEVARGDTIVWVNKDLVPHTVTSPAGVFDSKQIDPGKSWRYTPRRAGRFAYVCSFHPTMTAAIRVR